MVIPSPKYLLQTAEELLPAVICALIRCLLIGTEAGLLHANMRAALGWSQRPQHHPLEPAAVSANAPVIGEAASRSTTSTSQSTMPFQFGMGSARNWNFRPDTGSKSFFISHCARSVLSVSARHSFSGGCGNTLSITTVRGRCVGHWFISPATRSRLARTPGQPKLMAW